MFKAQVLRRNFSLFNRVSSSRIAQSAARNGHETVTVQRFRIRKPFVSRSRLVGIVAVSWASYSIIQYLGLEVQVEVIEKEQKPPGPGNSIQNQDEDKPDAGWEQATGEEEDDDDDDEDYDDVLLFLPTGFSRPAPRMFWRGSDPEWQEFRKIATDGARINKIRGELATMVRTSAVMDALWVKTIGKVDSSKGKQWIDINFPPGPPPEFERPGIELTEDLEWRRATRPVEHLAHQRLNQLIYPTAVGTALYQDTKRKAEQSWKGLKAYMGWEVKPEHTALYEGMLQRLPNHPALPSSVTTPPNTASTSPPTSTPQTTTSPSDSPTKDVGIALPRAKDMTLDLGDFRKDFRKAFKPYAPEPPRGCFNVLGLIEVYGDRARITLQVKAIYDPKQARYVGVQVNMFNFVEHRQQPRGGP
ncbi:hypothetical protein P153DRAFT_354360 [Dothidotthia symphoricarpi CBS 119687]|uniref:Uncharacterized protein n=1 Tax=Dothidotthia symphoricarpi CBS 119687 TaxID=1392245 RepID=A0A6A6AMX5_9PLEO|nr:uncharacterized protein P153DRAFT_354360 [Dothidotthia symphoricarpi CBS 119687]KAF2132916.1 hypothetical protein P153DRAFT_354360 [Dothidotthia symphoricarpi CBS 119687]